MRLRTESIPARLAAACVMFAANASLASQARIDLSSVPDAWVMDGGSLRSGELILDGVHRPARAFHLPLEWQDVTLTAQFMVEPAAQGVLGCGLVVGARDASTGTFVHFDRTQAILCRSDETNPWIELKRVTGLVRPAGEWHTAVLERRGPAVRVFLAGRLLAEAQDIAPARGRIGFYASEGRVHIRNIAISGESRPATTPFTIPPPAFVHVCRDAGAGGYEAFPDVCRLADGRLMAVFYAGYDHISLPSERCPRGGRISCCTSEDEGNTWSPARVLYDGPDDDRDPSIAQLGNGRLICSFFQLRRGAGGHEFRGSWVVTSEDAGRTWSTPRQVAERHACSSPVRELPDGRLVMGLYRETDKLATGAVIFSEDGGRTWGKIFEIDPGGRRYDAETDVIRLKDGSLYAVERSPSESMGFSISRDGGHHWSVSEQIGFPGHCPYLLRTRDDVIVLAHRLPQTSLHFSRNECRTWSENVVVDRVIGAYPSMVSLKDGSVLIVYYEEGPGSSIRARRFRVGPDGLEWLSIGPPVSPQTRAGLEAARTGP